MPVRRVRTRLCSRALTELNMNQWQSIFCDVLFMFSYFFFLCDRIRSTDIFRRSSAPKSIHLSLADDRWLHRSICQICAQKILFRHTKCTTLVFLSNKSNKSHRSNAREIVNLTCNDQIHGKKKLNWINSKAKGNQRNSIRSFHKNCNFSITKINPHKKRIFQLFSPTDVASHFTYCSLV